MSEFKHIIRIADTDIDGKKKVVFALTQIKGIGCRVAKSITNYLGIDPNAKLGELDDETVDRLKKFVEEDIEQMPDWMMNRRKDRYSGRDLHLLSKDVDFARMVDIEMMMRMKCYRGIRHAKGKKVRGQRTRSTGRSGRTVGVIRRKK
ncbi:SSU ribosomal protein S13P [Archaeoglobus sulfaticallidus PM70-1]|uniref:Small ribosomal subunit protein uS13 n=1 Tax=Archaeoglobus sulfaticallidus PM70-1 TaxID=387631 RepID=N0BJI5_9EURY|nr:30S ribosomal protein S13 [Archaeoglobus sulfaticallidus]AGK60641.1 SSU ribosomal protein S13P [Archaeoglobus sulfaticallidus PM70-1]